MATLRVPAEYETIADACAAAQSGDIIEVAGGHVDPDETVQVWEIVGIDGGDATGVATGDPIDGGSA